MKAARLIGLGAAFALMGSAPALADNDKTPPGQPCPTRAAGNPCNGNNGNIGQQGNAGDKVKYDHKPAPIDIAVPAVSGRGAYITQVGAQSAATIVQTGPNALAIVDQDGDGHSVEVTQQGSGLGFVQARQRGEGNEARISQDGSGQNVLYVTQSGSNNWLLSHQLAGGGLHNGAILTQYGSGNDMLLEQDGSDNRALLTQNGDGNGMTAIQTGDGNRLTWTQNGNYLADLGITQTGSQTIQVTQTGGR